MRELFISIDLIKFRVLTKNFPSEQTPIILLHGFSGNGNDWQFMFDQLNNSYPLIAIDLIGHGKTVSPNNPMLFTEDSQIIQLDKILDFLKIDLCLLLGYSMGGRLALAYSIKNQHRVKCLILESASPGIEDKRLRDERVIHDKALAARLRIENTKDFFNFWYSLPVFASLQSKPKLLLDLINTKLENDKVSLANSLENFSTGKMKDYWSDISNLDIPTLLICGELDAKYVEICKRMNSLISNSKLIVVKNSGHITHLEKPSEFINFVNSFLRTFE